MGEIQPFIFDFDRFYTILEGEARTLFEYAHTRWSNDTIYACGFASHSEEFESLHPLIFTQKYLDVWLKEKRKREYQRFKGMSLTNLRWYYRYRQPLDYRTDETLQKAFLHSNRLIARGGASLLGMWIDAAGKLTIQHADDMIKPHLTRFRATCINVLRQLNRDGLFGKQVARDSMILMINYSGYTDDDPAGRIVGALNSPEIVNRYRIEMAKASSFDMLIRRNQKI